jgi:hypothetical protein
LAWKSGLKVPFLPFGCSCPAYCQQRAVKTDPESLNSNKKGAKLPLLSAEGCHTRLDGQDAKGAFSRVEKPSDDLNSRLFLMNKKGLKVYKNLGS